MLWREFIEGTACKDTPHNYQVYKDLEILYMNSDKTHEEIYVYGRKLVDNSLTENEREQLERFKFRLANHKETLDSLQKSLESYKWLENKDMVKYCRQRIRVEKDIIKNLRAMIKDIK